ncbi:MAG: hypothetical protein HZC54_23535 [Verrucomicrobia bacterium]|nr:hypothetical protein [Verrucomicrobiota bacterium]
MSKKKPSPPKVRRLWSIKPVERVKPSAKVYSRRKLRPLAADDSTA